MSTADTRTITYDMPRRGVCSVCGRDAYDGRATKCEEHRTAASRKAQTAPRSDAPPITVDRPTKPPADDKEQRRDKLEASILHDLNPALVRGFALACRPIPQENFYTVSPVGQLITTQLGREAEIGAFEANVLARAAAELEGSPVAQSAKAVAGPIMPFILGGGAIIVLALHGAKLAGMRANLVSQYAAQLSREQASQAEGGGGEQDQAQGPDPDKAPPPPTSTNGPVADTADFGDFSVA